MAMLTLLPPLPEKEALLLDASLLTALLFPILYYFVYRPYNDNLQTLHSSLESQQLACLAYRHSSEAMLITDPTGTILDVNPAFTTITGYEAAEAIGRRPNLLSSGLQDQAFYKNLWEALLNSGRWEGEIINRRKDGTMYVEWLTVSSTRDESGRIHRYVAQFVNITRRKNTEELIWRQANFDPLTNLPNRALFFDRFSREILQAMRNNKKVALFFLDLDGFKDINDRHGHKTGDFVLKTVARRLLDCLRLSDTIARLGGDEFALIVADLESPEQAIPIAEKMLHSLAQEITSVQHPTCHVGTSIGISLYPDNGFEMDTLLSAADTAMYESKNRGRNHFTFSRAGAPQASSNDWITLNPDDLVGVPDIDREHQELVTLVNDMNHSLMNPHHETTRKIFETIFELIEHHFDTEEAIMKRIGYPDRVSHQRGHQIMKTTLERIKDSLNQSNEMLAAQLLKNWALDHVRGADQELGRYIRSREHNPEPGPPTFDPAGQ